MQSPCSYRSTIPLRISHDFGHPVLRFFSLPKFQFKCVFPQAFPSSLRQVGCRLEWLTLGLYKKSVTLRKIHQQFRHIQHISVFSSRFAPSLLYRRVCFTSATSLGFYLVCLWVILHPKQSSFAVQNQSQGRGRKSELTPNEIAVKPRLY